MSLEKKQVFSKPFNLVFEKNYPNLLLGPGIYNNYKYAQNSTPKKWINNKSLEDISKIRKEQIFTFKKYNKHDASKYNKYLEETQLLTQSIKTTELEVNYNTKTNFVREEFSGTNNKAHNLEKLRITQNIRVPRTIDKIVNDHDLKAKEGIINFYTKTKDIYKAQQLLSVGLLGVKKNRTLVPTRWSITGCDDIVSKELILEEIIYNNHIKDYLLFTNKIYQNEFIIIMLPHNWGFEMIEKKGNLENIDYEINKPKKEYAYNVTGGYYAARLEVVNYLNKINKQGKVLILRNIDPKYQSQGVWVIREAIKKALENKPISFNDLKDCLDYIQLNFNKDFKKNIINSNIIKEYKSQKRLIDFFTKKL